MVFFLVENLICSGHIWTKYIVVIIVWRQRLSDGCVEGSRHGGLPTVFRSLIKYDHFVRRMSRKRPLSLFVAARQMAGWSFYFLLRSQKINARKHDTVISVLLNNYCTSARGIWDERDVFTEYHQHAGCLEQCDPPVLNGNAIIISE